MAWKRFAVGQAEIAARGLEDRYLHSCIAQSQCLLSRIAGNMDQAASSLGDLGQGKRSSTVDIRMHSAIGQATIQQSLNCIQVEDLSAAKRLLEHWSPLGQSPSPMEEVLLFRKDMMLGRVLRFQGEFAESLAHLERARKTAEQRKDLIFDEDLRDLTCDLADTLRELDDPASAEHHLRAEIERRDWNCTSSSGRSLLELSLAEALFGQGRFKEAERLCLDVQSRPGLLKFERLRLHITLAKIRHVDSDNEDALSCWGEAMRAIGKFRLTNGRTTRIIVISICDTLRCLGHTSLVRDSLKEVATLDELAKPGGVQYWIAGLRHWLEYLQSRSLRSRM
jgi:tetratricopeptide (TPR) repeat protein